MRGQSFSNPFGHVFGKGRQSVLPFVLFASLLTTNTALFAQPTFFVSPNGSDKNEGSLQRPFQTIARTQQAVRNTKGKIIVYLRGGTYFLDKPIVFEAADGRPGKQSVTYCVYKKEAVVISSAPEQKLHWAPYRGPVMVAKIDTSLLWDQLFVNNELQRMARYPNFNPAAKVYGGTDSAATAKERVKGWARPQGGYLHALHKSEWGDFHYRILGKTENGQLQLEGGWQNNRQSALHKTHRFVENVFEELDTVNEWYVDKSKGLLYYYPPANFNSSSAVIQSPQLKHLVEFRGTPEKPVTNIHLEGIRFTHTLRSFMDTKEPLLRSDWTIYRGGAVLLEGTSNCVVRNCVFENLGGNAVFFSGYNKNDSVGGCLFENLGASAICFVGESSAVRSPLFEYGQSQPITNIDRQPGPQNKRYPSGCAVYDNLIRNIGTVEKQVAGVQLSMSQNITVSHNTIYNTPRAGININDGTWGGHVVEYNDVFNTVLETGDHGAFNSWGRDRYWHPVRDSMNALLKETGNRLVLLDAVQPTVLRYNRFRCDHGWDIDLDDGSSNYRIYNNLLLNGGLKLREGFYRIVENNVIINNSFHPHVWFANSGDVFRHNIVTTGYYPIRIKEWGKEVDRNIFLDSAGLNTAKKENHDLHSIYAPNAVSKAGDGYVFADTALLRTTGFTDFNQKNFGVVSPLLKAIAAKPAVPRLLTAIAATDKHEYEAFGLLVKNVSAGERSATGMDGERGVYVVEVNPASPFRGLLKPNDVLLEMNGKILRDVRTLLELKNVQRFNKAIFLQVFRDQRLQAFLWQPK